MAGGTYPDTSIGADSTKTSTDDVVFQPAAGASVTLSGVLHVAAEHLELSGLTHTGTLWVDATAADVTFRKRP